MATLSKNWITERAVDFEYKKYILLAYLQEVEAGFGENRLYPYFSDLIDHYRNLNSIKQNKNLLSEQFPQQLENLDPEKLKLEYSKILEDDELMQEIEQIIDYSLPHFQKYLEEGKRIFEFIEQQLFISTVGLIPLRNDYGYLFLQNGEDRETRVYRFESTIFEGPEERFKGLQTTYVTSYSRNLGNTFEWMRSDLMRNDPFHGNPATYAIESGLNFPYTESLLPVAKRMLIRYINA